MGKVGAGELRAEHLVQRRDEGYGKVEEAEGEEEGGAGSAGCVEDRGDGGRRGRAQKVVEQRLEGRAGLPSETDQSLRRPRMTPLQDASPLCTSVSLPHPTHLAPPNIHRRKEPPRIALLAVRLDRRACAEPLALGENQVCERVHIDEVVVVRQRLPQEALERDPSKE